MLRFEIEILFVSLKNISWFSTLWNSSCAIRRYVTAKRNPERLLWQIHVVWNVYIFFRNIHMVFCYVQYSQFVLIHGGRVTHICVSKQTNTGSDNGLSPGRRQAIIWTNAGILLIRPLGTNFSEILGEIHSFSFSKMHLKMSSAK